MPPRPKYPSDSIHYHKRRKPDRPHSVRLPEDKMDRFYELQDCLGLSIAGTVRFIMDAADPAIVRVLEDSRRVVQENPSMPISDNTNDGRRELDLSSGEGNDSDDESLSFDGDDEQRRYYLPGFSTHTAVEDFLLKHITYAKMKFYVRARENFISEMYHSINNKFVSKRIDRSHYARLAAAALDWNENISRKVMKVYMGKLPDTAVRKSAYTIMLQERSDKWKRRISTRMFL